jgi:hypothetical protein
MPTALRFAASSGNLVNCGSGASIDQLTAGSTGMWVFPTSIAVDQRYWQKGLAGTGNYWGFAPDFAVGSGTFGIEAQRASVNCEAISTTGVVKQDAWNFVGASWNTAGAAGDQRLFWGLSRTPASEPTYSSQTAGSGAVGDNSPADLIIANRSTGGVAMPGRIGCLVLFATRLGVSDMRDVQSLLLLGMQGRLHPREVRVRLPDRPRLLMFFNGTGKQLDWSGNGNHGTVTGAVTARGVVAERNTPVRRRYSVEDAAGVTASVALTVGQASLSASSTHTPPTYTGAADLTVGQTTLSASATFDPPVFTATVGLTGGAATLAASASHDVPVYTATVGLTAGAAALAATAAYTPPGFNAEATLTTGPATLAASATHTAPVYTAGVALTAPAAAMVSSAVFTPAGVGAGGGFKTRVFSSTVFGNPVYGGAGL